MRGFAGKTVGAPKRLGAQPHADAHMHSLHARITRTYARTRVVRSCIHTKTHPDERARTCSHTCTRTRTRTHTHTRARAIEHTHTAKTPLGAKDI